MIKWHFRNWETSILHISRGLKNIKSESLNCVWSSKTRSCRVDTISIIMHHMWTAHACINYGCTSSGKCLEGVCSTHSSSNKNISWIWYHSCAYSGAWIWLVGTSATTLQWQSHTCTLSASSAHAGLIHGLSLHNCGTSTMCCNHMVTSNPERDVCATTHCACCTLPLIHACTLNTGKLP